MRVAGYGLRVAGCGLRVAGYGLRVTGCGLRVAGYWSRVARCVVVPIVLVVVLVLVIEKAEYVLKMRWGVEDEYKDEYESLARCGQTA